MTIAEKLRTEFPGICVLFAALKRAWKAYRAYNKAIKAVSVIVVPELTNEWAYKVSERSQLSYEGAQSIYTFITEETDLCTHAECSITEFVMDMANRGHTADMIILYLLRIDRELDKWARDKLRIRL